MTCQKIPKKGLNFSWFLTFLSEPNDGKEAKKGPKITDRDLCAFQVSFSTRRGGQTMRPLQPQSLAFEIQEMNKVVFVCSAHLFAKEIINPSQECF